MKSYPQYKDSGIEWIGDVPEHWDVKRSDGIIFSDKNLVDPDSFSDEEVYHYSIPAIQEYRNGIYEDGKSIKSAKQIITEPCLLVSKLNPRKSTICIASPQSVKTISSTEFVVLKTRFCLLEFLCYFCQSDFFRQYLDSRVQSVTRSHQRVSPEDIYRFFAAWPSKEEQTAIAAFLDRKTAEIDSIIAKKERLIELYEEEKAAVINHAVTKGLNPAAKMKDSGIEWLGEIPENWEVKQIKRVAHNVITGKTPPSSEESYYDGDINWFGPSDFSSRFILLDSKRKISNRAINECGIVLCPKYSIFLVGIGATIGKIGIILNQSASNQQINAIILNDRELNHFYGLYFLSSYKDVIISMSNAATLPIFNQTQTKEFEMLIPPLHEQAAIVQHIETKCSHIDAIISKFKRQIELLKEYRTALISEAVTGKIDLRHEI